MQSLKRNIKKSIFTLFVLGVTLGLVCTGSGAEQDPLTVVEVTSSAVIDGDNVAASREQAIQAGLVSAVALATADILPIHSQVEHFEKLNRDLYVHVDKYVQDYKVLTELTVDNQYRVVVQATVMMDRLREQLSNSGIILSEKAIPSVLFFITEERLDSSEPMYWWGENKLYVVPSSEAAMAEVLQRNGFTIVSHGNLVAPLNHALEISLKDATAIARHLNADIIVLGKSQVQKTSNVMGDTIRSYKAGVSVRAYLTETGETLATVARAAIAAGDKPEEASRDALANAGTFTGEALSEQIVAARLRAAAAVPSVEIVVVGTGELKNFVNFRKILGTVDGVSGINIKEIKPNESTITVEYPGSGENLAEQLMLKTYDTFGIDIFEVSPERLGIELMPE